MVSSKCLLITFASLVVTAKVPVDQLVCGVSISSVLRNRILFVRCMRVFRMKSKYLTYPGRYFTFYHSLYQVDFRCNVILYWAAACSNVEH